MGTPVSSTVSAGQNILVDQYNNLRADALNPGSMSEPISLADFLQGAAPEDILLGIGGFSDWPGGYSQPPAGWKRSSVSASVKRLFLDATTPKGAGISITTGQYIYTRIYQSVQQLRGKWVTACYRGTNGATVTIADDAGTTVSTETPVGQTFAQNSVARLIDANATFIEIRINGGGAFVYHRDVVLMPGRFVWLDWAPREVRQKIDLAGAKDIQVYRPSRDDSIITWTQGLGTSWQDIGPFPKISTIVSIGTKVAIYNEQAELWMEFNAGTDNVLEGTTNASGQVHMRNGKLFICWDKTSPDTATGLVIVDFVNDIIWRVNSTGAHRYKGAIYSRNAAAGYTSIVNKTWKLAGTRVYSVHSQIVNGDLYAAVGSQAGGLSLLSFSNTSAKRYGLFTTNASSAVPQLHLTPWGTLVFVDTFQENLYVKDSAVSAAFPVSSSAGVDPVLPWSRFYKSSAYSEFNVNPRLIACTTVLNAAAVPTVGRRLDVSYEISDDGVRKNKIFFAADAGVTVLIDNTVLDHSSCTGIMTASGYSSNLGAYGFFRSPSAGTSFDDIGPSKRTLKTPTGATLTAADFVWGSGAVCDAANEYLFEAPEVSYVVPSGTSTDLAIGDVAGNTRRSQGFQFTRAGFVGAVYLKIKKVGSPADNIQVSIQSDSSAKPSGTDVSPVIAIPGSAISAGYTFVRFAGLSSAALTATTQYHIVIKRSGANDGANYYVVEADNAGSYASGQVSIFNGSVWTGNSPASHDIGFEVYSAYSYILNGPSALVQTVRALSISGWWKPTAIGSAQTLVSKWSTAQNGRMYRLYINASGNVVLELSATGSSTIYSITSSIALGANNLHHVAVIWSGNEAFVNLYIDGVEDPATTTTGSLPGALPVTGARLALGCDWTDIGDVTAAQVFTGTVGQVSVAYSTQSYGSFVARTYEAGMKTIAYLALLTGIATSEARTFTLNNIKASSLALSGQLLVVGENNDADAGGVTVFETASMLALARVSSTTTVIDRSGNIYNGSGAFDTTAVAVNGNHFAYGSDAFAWLEQRFTELDAPAISDASNESNTSLIVSKGGSDVALTGSYTDVPGVSVTATKSGVWLIIASWDFDPTSSPSGINGAVDFDGQSFLLVNHDSSASGKRQLITKAYTRSIPNGSVITLRAQMSAGTGEIGALSSLTAVWLRP